jgi:hypothetical protein
MKTILLLFIVFSGCRERGEPDTNGQAPAAERSVMVPSRLSTLTGLYENGSAASRGVLCILGRRRTSRFGLVVRVPDDRTCSGSGAVTRHGSGVTFRMAGDSPCTIVARISGSTIVFPEAIPPGCSYYCGAHASMARARLTRVTATSESALSARDLVGEPLCGED